MLDSLDALMFARGRARSHQFRGKRAIQDIAHQCGFSRPRNAGDADQPPQWNGNVDVLQIIRGRADDLQYLAVAVAPLLRDFDLLAPREVLSRQRLWVRQNLLWRPLGDDMPAMLTRRGTQIHDPVCFTDGFIVVLNDEHRVPQIPQTFEGIQQSFIVTRVQTDGRFVQHVQHADQP